MISLKTLEYKKRTETEQSKLVIEIKVDKYEHPINIVNTIRRTIFSQIPQYAFEPSVMQFTVNTSIMNNDMLRSYLSQFPIYDIDSERCYIEPITDYIEYTKKSLEYNEDKHIDMYIGVKNTTNKIIQVTTNDIKYVINNEMVKNPYNEKYPLLIVELKPGQEINCKLVGVIGIPQKDIIFSPVSNCYYTYENKDKTINKVDDNKFIFNIFSTGQLTEYKILDKACDNIIYNLQLLNNKIKAFLNNTNENVINRFDIPLINSSICKLINDQLQLDSKVKYAGLEQPSLLDRFYKMKIILDKSYKIDDIIDIIDNNINILIKIYENFKKENNKNL